MDAQCLIITTLTLQASIDTMLTDLADALRRAGLFTRTMVDLPQAPNQPLLRGLVGDLRQAKGRRLLIDVNAKTDFPIGMPDGSTGSIHDAWDIPRLSFFESNPLHHRAYLARAPRNLYCSVVDPSHLYSLAALGVQTRGQNVCPHAGPPPLTNIPDSQGRDIPVLFVGNLGPIPPHDQWLDQLTATPDERTITEQAWQAHFSGGESGLQEVDRAAAACGAALSLDRRIALALSIEARANARHRLDSLMAIRSTPVHILGDVHPSHTLPACHVRVGPVNFAAALAMMERSRLLLNFMPFRGGAHERVFYGLSRGACSLSDPSSLLQPGCHPQEGGVILRASPDLLDEQVRDLTSDLTALDRRRNAGQAWYGAEHCWDHRAKTLLQLLNLD